MSTPLAIYTSHDASIAVRAPDGTYHVAELERIAGVRYLSLDNPVGCPDWLNVYERGLDAAKNWLGGDLPDSYLTLNPISEVTTHPSWSPTRHLRPTSICGHHDAHAACAFYQSPFDEAIILSYDGGGPDLDGRTQFFCVYRASRTNGIERLSAIDCNLGSAYLSHASYVDEIQSNSRSSNWMSWAGKLMALAAYGTVDKAALALMLNGGHSESIFKESFRHRQLDWCATVQEWHLRKTLQHLVPFIADRTIPICVTGGCALNVKVNQHLRDLGYNVFVPPNPNDCGLTLGMLLWRDRPQQQVVCTYNGLPWTGGEASYPPISLDQVSRRLEKGQIIGFIEGDSELGPRALGHRSILCRGDLPHARPRLNAIKGREWYRPVSPVLRGTGDPFMSFARDCRAAAPKEWIHIDGTARVQTVEDRSASLWRLMEPWLDRVLINTSLNLKGRPLCNNFSDALELLRSTALDCLVINGHLIEK